MIVQNREFVTEHMPDGWAICERCIDGALNVITTNISTADMAKRKLWQLRDSLLKRDRKRTVSLKG